jgi:GH15 family glucan-1,4-alpha-glucosidase
VSDSIRASWKTPTGWVVVRDALTMGPRRGEDTVTRHTRPPSDEDADHALVRTAQCIDGSVEIDLVCEPGFDYGRLPGGWTLSPDRHRADAKADEQALRLQTDMLVGIEAGRARARHVLRAGETVYCALAWSDEALVPTSGDEAADQLDATTRFWRDWLARAAIPDHELGPMIQRSALTITGLTYMPTGATVAALTTSLPETPAGERNWDYRYTWIRDSTFLLRALHYLLLDWEADEFMQFMADLERNDDGGLQIMYGIDGRRDLTESVRKDLSGYDGAHPVRIGNGAFDQRQNDVFGAALDSVLLDPSTLLAAILGFLPGDDARLRATLLAIEDELTEQGYVLRYRTEETDDGLSGKEGSFLICSFWLVSALAIIGEPQRARHLMERLVKAASPLGLYAEEFDAETGRHLGNFPQAFSHLALVEAAARIIVAEGLKEVVG